MLIRRLGAEAKEILESSSITDANRLSVPLLRKEAPSATETSDITSLCSLSSQDFASLHHSDSQKKRKSPALAGESPKLPSNNQCNGETAPKIAEPMRNGVGEPPQIAPKTEAVQTIKRECSPVQTAQQPIRDLHSRRRTSMKTETHEEVMTCHRRVSVPSNLMVKKKDGQQHVVAKSELWDTGSQHRCVKSHQKIRDDVCMEDEDDRNDGFVHGRTVSERRSQKRDKSPVVKKDLCNQQCNKYYQSTPNVASTKRAVKKDKSFYNAGSESELLDREILPIFQKLLTERNKSQHNIDYSFGRSCPNISIKCDIVEYL